MANLSVDKLMKLTFFYFFLLLPVVGYLIVKDLGHLDSRTFVTGLFVYLFIYHPVICGLKLILNKVIKWNQFYLNFIPTWNFRYFNTIFLKN
jgi:hypothetical protein